MVALRQTVLGNERMKLAGMIGAAAALFGAEAATADVTARYRMGPAVMTIQVDEGGASRISMGSQMAIVARDGVTYFVAGDLAGTFAVRQDEMIAAMMQHLDPPNLPRPPADSEGGEDSHRIVRRGTETVAGRTGTVYVIEATEQESAARAGGAGEYVISDDATLAPVGRVFARQFAQSGEGMAAALGPAILTQTAMPQLRTLLERGTLLRMGRILRLESVETAPIDAAAFELPETVLTGPEFAERMGIVVAEPDRVAEER